MGLSVPQIKSEFKKRDLIQRQRTIYSSQTNDEAVSRFVGYFPMLFQYTTFVAFISLFFSTLTFMFSMRLVREKDKYSIPGLTLLLLSLYLLAVNIWNLM